MFLRENRERDLGGRDFRVLRGGFFTGVRVEGGGGRGETIGMVLRRGGR